MSYSKTVLRFEAADLAALDVIYVFEGISAGKWY